MLTVLGIEKLKPKEKPYKVSDGNSLHVLVEPTGVKLWRVRFKFGATKKCCPSGRSPKCRSPTREESATKHLRCLRTGSIRQTKKQDKLIAEIAGRDTFGPIAEEHLQRLKESGVAEATLNKNRWLLFALASPLTKRPIAKTTPLEILVLLQKQESGKRRGGYEA